MPWQRMAPHTRTLRQQPTVAIGSGGAIYLNAFAMTNYFKGVQVVALLYDPAAHRLGIQAVARNETKVFRLNFSNKTASTGVISARSVVKHLGLKYDKATLVFDGKWDQKTRILEVDLQKYEEKPRG